MTRWLFSTIALLIPMMGLAAGCARAAADAPAVYYVNYEAGDDRGDGLTAAAAWRHAPGDPKAQGVPARTILRPGDTVTFAKGLRYRGEIHVNGSGTVNAPIVFTSAPGGMGIIDGSDPVAEVRPCRSAADCGGTPLWQTLVRITFREVASPETALFTDKGALFRAQAPDVDDIFYSDNIEDYLEARPEDLEAGRVRVPHEIAARMQDPTGGSLALWVYGNQVVSRPITAVEGDFFRFDPSGMKFYTNRPGRFAVLGRPELVDRPGEFAFIEQGAAAVAYLPAGAQGVTLARGRGGIDLNGMSHIVIKRLAFENMSDDGVSIRTGVAVGNFARPASNISIEENSFANFRMPKGQGPVTLRNASAVRISRNVISHVALGSGIRLSRASEMSVVGNQVRKVGRTGIMLMDVKGGEIARNIVEDVKGVHGNAISVYLGNENISVVSNTVSNAYRPMTFHGDGSGTLINNILIANNLFVAVPRSSAALSSWGNATRGVRIRDNILLGGKVGLLLSKEDVDVVVEGNVLNGVAYKGEFPEGWRVTGNREVDYTPIGEAAPRGGLERTIQELVTGRVAPERLKQACSLLGGSKSAPPQPKTVGARVRCDG